MCSRGERVTERWIYKGKFPCRGRRRGGLHHAFQGTRELDRQEGEDHPGCVRIAWLRPWGRTVCMGLRTERKHPCRGKSLAWEVCFSLDSATLCLQMEKCPCEIFLWRMFICTLLLFWIIKLLYFSSLISHICKMDIIAQPQDWYVD